MGDGDLHVHSAGEGDYHGAVLVDTLDDALNALDLATDETDGTVEVGEVYRTVEVGALAQRVVEQEPQAARKDLLTLCRNLMLIC